jgi:hypothetical protein
MRYLLVLITTMLILACGSYPPSGEYSKPQNASTDPTVEFLITAAATDFRSQRSPQPIRFRDVRSGYVVTAGGVRQYRLCGEFLPASEGGSAEWIAFVTIKTSPYEQWLGNQAVTFCKRASMTWDKEDLSSRLLSRLNALR